jgi:8-hydroxy-5-deazaflavin:NADPH oxidoreductase
MTVSASGIQIARVAIVGGTGALGLGLATALGRAGCEIVIASRSAERACHTADELAKSIPDGRFEGVANAEAGMHADVVIVSVPFAGHAEIVRAMAAGLQPGQLVIDTTVPLAPAVGGKATRVLGVWQGSAAQQTAELLPPGVHLVAALHTVSAALLARPEPLAQDVLVCGDTKAAKGRATELLERIPGVRCVDCGRLEQSRITEQITALLIGINIRYKTHAGLRITGLQAS